MINHPAPVTMRCPLCGSDDIVKDATAVWSVQEQRWELSGEQDHETCQTCGASRDFMAERVPAPAQEPAE